MSPRGATAPDLQPDPLLATPVLVCAGSTATWADVVADARRSGAWGELEADVAARAAGLRVAPPAQARVTAAAVAERKARRLLSADDLRTWLGRWGLTQDVWLDHVRRSVAEPGGATDEADPQQVWASAVCSGVLEAAALRLAEGLAAADALEEDPADPGTRERCRRRLADAAASYDAVSASVQARGVEGTRFRWLRAVLPSPDAAREAVLCLRDDGLTLEDLGVPATAHVAALDEVAPRLRPALLGAGASGLVHPVPEDAPGALLLVTERRSPDPDDPVLRAEAGARLRAKALAGLVAQRVVWTGPLAEVGA